MSAYLLEKGVALCTSAVAARGSAGWMRCADLFVEEMSPDEQSLPMAMAEPGAPVCLDPFAAQRELKRRAQQLPAPLWMVLELQVAGPAWGSPLRQRRHLEHH
mmetsp:Transcript_63921/g.152460  ORF Transcript_63921/g.152460 Transcript_63921/m.152460 type:complete len:103 (-) Transcript_63921:282-590(-)